jgi:hypothetical protein
MSGIDEKSDSAGGENLRKRGRKRKWTPASYTGKYSQRIAEQKIGRWRPKEEGDEKNTLLYIGSGWDMSFPLYKSNILIDQQPGLQYYESHQHGWMNGLHMQQTIHRQLQLILADLKFEDHKERNLWIWSSAKRDVTIHFFHSNKLYFRPVQRDIKSFPHLRLFDEDRFRAQDLPPEASQANILYIEGFLPLGIDELLPNLHYRIKGSGSIWNEALHFKSLKCNPPEPLLAFSDDRHQYLENIEESLRAGYWRELRLRYKRRAKRHSGTNISKSS